MEIQRDAHVHIFGEFLHGLHLRVNAGVAVVAIVIVGKAPLALITGLHPVTVHHRNRVEHVALAKRFRRHRIKHRRFEKSFQHIARHALTGVMSRGNDDRLATFPRLSDLQKIDLTPAAVVVRGEIFRCAFSPTRERKASSSRGR